MLHVYIICNIHIYVYIYIYIHIYIYIYTQYHQPQSYSNRLFIYMILHGYIWKIQTGGASVVPAKTGSLVPAESGSLVPAAVPLLRSYYMAFNKDVFFFHGPRTAFSVLEQAKQGYDYHCATHPMPQPTPPQ